MCKTAVGDSLRQQVLFLGASEAVKKTGMFVVLLDVKDKDSKVTLVLDYILSYLFKELIFANVSASLALTAIVDLFRRMSTSV